MAKKIPSLKEAPTAEVNAQDKAAAEAKAIEERESLFAAQAAACSGHRLEKAARLDPAVRELLTDRDAHKGRVAELLAANEQLLKDKAALESRIAELLAPTPAASAPAS